MRKDLEEVLDDKYCKYLAQARKYRQRSQVLGGRLQDNVLWHLTACHQQLAIIACVKRLLLFRELTKEVLKDIMDEVISNYGNLDNIGIWIIGLEGDIICHCKLK